MIAGVQAPHQPNSFGVGTSESLDAAALSLWRAFSRKDLAPAINPCCCTFQAAATSCCLKVQFLCSVANQAKKIDNIAGINAVLQVDGCFAAIVKAMPTELWGLPEHPEACTHAR